MKTTSLIRTVTGTLCLFLALNGCSSKKTSPENLQTGSNNSGQELRNDFAEEKTELTETAKQIISEYNSRAEDIKYDAIRNNKNLDTHIKMKLIDMESRIEKLQDKLENAKYQTNDSWNKFRDDLMNDIKRIREGIKDLPRTNIG